MKRKKKAIYKKLSEIIKKTRTHKKMSTDHVDRCQKNLCDKTNLTNYRK